MNIATRFGNHEIELRSSEWGTEHLIPSPDGYGALPTEAAAGLPAVGAAIRLITGTIASLPFEVWQGEGAQRKKRGDSWQALLLRFPNDEVPAVSFMADIVSAIESCGNAFVFKGRMPARRQIGALSTLHPGAMTVRRDRNTGELIYEFWNGRETQRLNPADVLHIRGETLGGGDMGYSPIQMHRRALTNYLVKESFEGQHYGNSARPGIVLKDPGQLTPTQAEEYANSWDAVHKNNPGQTSVLGGGMDIVQLPISLEDQQYVESSRFSVEDVERMYGLPPGALERMDGETSEQESLRLLKRLHPRIRRIENAFLSDPDLFGRDQELYPEFYPDELLRSDGVSMATIAKEKVQSGIWLVDEARAREGLPNLPPVPENPDQQPGKVPQIVPVGGQANPGSPPPQE